MHHRPLTDALPTDRHQDALTDGHQDRMTRYLGTFHFSAAAEPLSLCVCISCNHHFDYSAVNLPHKINVQHFGSTTLVSFTAWHLLTDCFAVSNSIILGHGLQDL